MERLTHPLEPVFDAQSRILILGTFPSPKSRRFGFYYSHPQNRFWPVMEAVYKENIPPPLYRTAKPLFYGIIWRFGMSCTVAASRVQTTRASNLPCPMTCLLSSITVAYSAC